jgi:nucleoside-diphosphate-sugar epimerase
MSGDCKQPLNLGSEHMISINDLALLIARLAGKTITINNIAGPVGVMGRNSHNQLIQQSIGWKPQEDLERGLLITYSWIYSQL